MTEIAEDPTLRITDKVAKLLEKAESTTPAEAEALMEHAQRLIRKHSITEELLARARGIDAPEEIVCHDVTFTDIFRGMWVGLGHVIATHNDCTTVQMQLQRGTRLSLIGHESDVTTVENLLASLQLQATRALKTWWADQDKYWMSAGQKFQARRTFLFGFNRGLDLQLRRAAHAGRNEATAAETSRVGNSETATTSVELVLRGKKQRVDDWMDERYGRSLRTVTRRYKAGGADAAEAGFNAGRSADVGRARLGKTPELEA